ncbi:MAG: hypothetical protein PV362_11470 [Providencia heimbachae]|nr:hypothetical protein [Providencia heimbachae]
MKMILKMGFVFTMILFLSACDDFDLTGDKGKFYYSNPTTSNISFKIDGRNYEVLPSNNGVISLSTGQHIMEDSQGNTMTFMVFEHNSGGILNPNHLVYYSLSEVFAVDGKEGSFKPVNHHVVINSHELKLPIRSADSQVIDANLFRCRYPVGEAFPDTITISNNKLDGNIQSKCFDQVELIKYFSNEYSENLLPEPSNKNPINSINMHFSYDIPMVSFSDPQMQFIAEQLINLVIQIKDSDDTDIHDELNKNFHQLTIDLVHAHTENTVNNSVPENEKYNDFINQINQLRSNGIWIK